MENERQLFDWRAHKDTDAMQLRQDAPSLSRPGSPQKPIITLPDIPEATPGPNAFAQQAARMERHRLDGNAFYQQEVQRRRVTPPTDVHPALRARGPSDHPPPSGLQIPEQRGSTVTTMSPFINAGNEKTPLLKPAPSSRAAQLVEPDMRGSIGECHERMVHELSGGDRERMPEYVYSPQTDNMYGFGQPSSTPRRQRPTLPKQVLSDVEAPPKSPKKSFFEKFGMSKLLGASPSPSMSTLASSTSNRDSNELPPKAQAVLGASPPKTYVSRSPSKQRKGMFSGRKSTDTRSSLDANVSKVSLIRKAGPAESGLHSRPSSTQKTPQTGYSDPPLTGTTQVNKTPQTGFSDSTHYSGHAGARMPSQTFSEQGGTNNERDKKCTIVRSQSLKYFDHAPPPTPPAKNTPPNAKAKLDGTTLPTTRQRMHGAAGRRLPFAEATRTSTSDPAGFVSVGASLSPTRFGSYGHKETPRLVTRPSIYSMHASVVPELNDATTFEEMKARVDGLGLEGFSMPSENQSHATHDLIYSPSIYSIEWGPGARPQSVLRSPKKGQTPLIEHMPVLRERPLRNDSRAHCNKISNSSEPSIRTVEICYPDMKSNRSFKEITPLLKQPPNTASHRRSHGGLYAEEDLPEHGRTHSRDHSESPRQAADNSSWLSKEGSVDASLFAVPIDEHSREKQHASPASFNHPSAMPSPLQYLPASTYVAPPTQKTGGRQVDAERHTESPAELHHSTAGLGIRDVSGFAPGSPSRNNNLLDNAPLLEARSSLRNRASPRPSINSFLDDADADVDPRKQGTGGQAPDKLDQMLEILSRLNARNEDFASMRDEMRVSNNRLDKRLAAVEGLRTSPLPASPTDISAFSDDVHAQDARQRVVTGDAHDFYRHRPSPPNTATEASSETSAPAESEAIAELRETKKRLEEMLNGYAAKLEEMERKLGNSA